MKAFYTTIAIAAQAAAFSMAKTPIAISRCTVGASRLSKTETNTSLKLHPASAAGLLLRGGAAVAAAATNSAVPKNFYSDALGFFGSVRTPATFLAGSSLAAIFSLKDVTGDALLSSAEAICEQRLSTLEKFAVKFYQATCLFAFLLSLNATVTATVAHTSILHGGFDPMASTAYALMKREFEYEFVFVRWSFLMSIFCFLGMVASRILIEFRLLRSGNENEETSRRDAAAVVAYSFGALAANQLSNVNSTLWCWNSLIGMTGHLARMIGKRAFVERRPLDVVSILCTIASVYYVGKLALNDLDPK